MMRPPNAIQLLQRVRTRIYRDLDEARRGSSVPTQGVFIVGCGRSGTSMLLARLARSWQVDIYNEDHPSVFSNFRLKGLKDIEHVIRRSDALLAVFKPILNTHQTVRLLREFPDSRALFVFRHFDDVVNSSLKRFGRDSRLEHVRSWVLDDFSEFGSDPPPESTQEYMHRYWSPEVTAESAAALYWLFYNRLYFDLGLVDHPRVELVNYELLVQKPESEFERVSEFLGIRFRSSMVEGIYNSSIEREAPPVISDRIRKECESLFARLLDLVPSS